MSSILTNNSAMVALQTMKSINKNLANVQSEISTGKSVGSAKDNAAVWAISKVMESDVKGFDAISGSLSLGESTVAVAQNASETITDLLTQIKGKIVGAQEENVDRVKIQDDIEALRNQIKSVVGAAQFNGLNLLQNGDTTAGSGTVDILSSLDRQSNGSVESSSISVGKKDLRVDQQQVIGTTAVGTLTDYITGTAAAINGGATAAARTFGVQGGTVAAGVGYRISLSTPIGTANVGNGSGPATPAAGVYEYVARDGDTAQDVAKHLASAMKQNGVEGFNVAASAPDAAGNTSLTFDFDANTDGFTIAVAAFTAAGAESAGGLAALAQVDVSTTAGAESALSNIEGLLQTSIDASAAFGSSQSRISTQSDFVDKLTSSLKSGIGALVDADMEEASARLQALQVQQQLATQALSIANQAPQSILSLFR